MQDFNRYGYLSVVLALAMLFSACDRDREGAEQEMAEQESTNQGAVESAPEAAVAGSMVEVEIFDFGFDAPETIASGWSTFRVRNSGEQEHFMLLWKLPEGATFEDWKAEVVTAFDEPMTRYEAGELDQEGMFEALLEGIPDWFFDAEPAGGVALLSPGEAGQSTVDLAPGTYVMECYVRAPDGQFHGMLGMIREMTVTDATTGAEAPGADVDLAIANDGITIDGEFVRGEQTVRVTVTEAPEGLLGHDAHLVKLDDETELDEVITWMDWVDAYRSPGPDRFLGGAEDLPEGGTAYVTVDLEPGEYAWVSESYAEQGVVKRFTVE